MRLGAGARSAEQAAAVQAADQNLRHLRVELAAGVGAELANRLGVRDGPG